MAEYNWERWLPSFYFDIEPHKNRVGLYEGVDIRGEVVIYRTAERTRKRAIGTNGSNGEKMALMLPG